MSDEPKLDSMESLFSAGKAELPAAAAKAKAASALGIGGAAAVGAAGAGTAGALKLIGVVAVAAAAFGGGLWVGDHRARAELKPQLSAPLSAPPPTPHEEPPPPPEQAETPPPAAPIEPQPPPTTEAAPKSKPATRSTPGESADALTQELAAIDRARMALRNGDAALTLKTLAEYERAFPQGVMKTEAALVRIEAMVASGDRASAEKEATRLLSSGAPQLVQQRVQRLLDAK